ncbi:MAG TPA: hypothetical protein VFB23_05465 [Candidatus Acidoferrales bacterium]|jgi:hypothetical protein|nr:hypothetical protein [Candidatus Acidoferrales bacterium]
MMAMSHSLMYLFISWGVVTAVLFVLVIYGNALSSREEDQLYLNKAEQAMMASEQQVLISKMNQLARIIIYLAVLSGLLLMAWAAVWVWVGLNR